MALTLGAGGRLIKAKAVSMSMGVRLQVVFVLKRVTTVMQCVGLFSGEVFVCKFEFCI